MEAVKTALNGTDIEAIKTASEKLTEVSYEVFGKIYQQNAQAGAQPGPDASNGAQQSAPEDNVVDAEYEVVDDDNNK